MIRWIDAGAGASGDMLLGALLDLDPQGLPHAQAAVDEVTSRLGEERVVLGCEPTTRAGLRATRALVPGRSATARTWADIAPAVTGRAHEVFAALAEAEARVHGIPEAQVHFHEVGALDAIADIVAVCALWERLGPGHTVVSPVCVGSGVAQTMHGLLTVPGPAVTELLTGVPTFAGPVRHEACTPTGAALLRTFTDEWGPQPLMTVRRTGVGAGGRDPGEQPNVLRVLIGEQGSAQTVLQVEATIDDLDPRLYPDVVSALKSAGALEVWLTPVIMKHGRPGVTVTALTPADARDAVTTALFRHTTTLGARWWQTDRWTLDRDVVTVEVEGQRIAVKRGWLAGEVVTGQPEYADVVAAARALGRPVREVLQAATRTADKKGSDATDGGDSDVRTPRN
jgi:uncharacterized protein (TIGR00299 family) protein